METIEKPVYLWEPVTAKMVLVGMANEERTKYDPANALRIAGYESAFTESEQRRLNVTHRVTDASEPHYVIWQTPKH